MKMRKIHIVAAILALLAATAILGSCRKEPQWTNELGDKLVGAWYAEYDAAGSFELNTEVFEFTHIAQYAEFNSDCTGIWWVAFFSKNPFVPVFMFGGEDVLDAATHFNSTSGGHINVSRDITVDGVPNSWTVHFMDNKIIFADGGFSTQYMLRATPAQKAQMIKWEQSLNGNDSVEFGLGDYPETVD